MSEIREEQSDSGLKTVPNSRSVKQSLELLINNMFILYNKKSSFSNFKSE